MAGFAASAARRLVVPVAAAGAATAAIARSNRQGRQRQQAGGLSPAWCLPALRCEGLQSSTSSARRSSQLAREFFPPEPTISEFLSFETYIFDCDGVIWGIPEEDTRRAVATINHLLRLDKRVMFITNNSNKSRQSFVKELEKRGLDFGTRTGEEKLHMMISASFTTANFLRSVGVCRPFVITSETGLLDELRLAGIKEYFAAVNDDGTTPPEFESALMKGGPADGGFAEVADIVEAHPCVDCIVVGWDLGLTARKVATAINYIKWHEDLHSNQLGYRPMMIVAASSDTSGVLGKADFNGQTVKLRAIGNGPMAEIIAHSFDPPREWLDCGKPSDTLLWMLRGVYKVDLQHALMVGDTLQTDIIFGNRGGMQTLLVFSGVTTERDLDGAVKAGNPMRKPTYVLPKLGAFHERGEID